MTYIDTLYCCVKTGSHPELSTLSVYKRDSIKKMLDGLTVDWNWLKRRGWKCIRVEVSMDI